MDTITQTILGATIAQAGFRHRLGPKAIVFGALCGLFPDLDGVMYIGGRWAMFIHHRGISHSLLFLLAITPLAGWLGYIWSKRTAYYLAWCHLAFWALLTHPLLDLCTSYGTQLFAPLSNHRFAIDAISIIDPVYTLPLLIALILGRFSKLSPVFCRRFAMGMLAFTTAYLSLGFYQSQRAIAIASRQLQNQGFSYTQVRATPTLLNIWLWRVIARDAEGNLQVGMLSTVVPRTIRFAQLKRPNDIWVQKTLDSQRGKAFEWFAMGMVSIKVDIDPKGTRVYLYDQRYGLVTNPTTAIFGAYAQFHPNGEIAEMKLLRNPRNIKISEELSTTYRLLCGRDASQE